MRTLAASLLLFVGCATTYPPADPVHQLGADIDAVLSDSIFSHTLCCVKVVSLNSGQTLYDRNSDLLVHPASNLKLFTSSTALQCLGEDFALVTSVLADSGTSDSVVHGSLYLKGFGDPDLDLLDLDSLARTIRSKGITKVEGDVVADASYFDDNYWGSGWMWDDEPDPDEMFTSALSVNRNCFTVMVMPTFLPGDSVIVMLEPFSPLISVECHAKTVSDTSDNTLTITRLFKERLNTVVVSGDIPRSAAPVRKRMSIREPARFAAELFQKAMERDSIVIAGNIRLGTTPAYAGRLAEIARPIDSVLVFMNKNSDNLSAENLLKIVGAVRRGVPGSTQNGLYVENEFSSTLGIDTTAWSPVDGSGVSHYNLVTVNDIVRLLAGIARRPHPFHVIYASLPIAGVDGTLATRMRGTAAQGNVRGKSGTINGVSSLSGYVATRDGELLAFSIVMENFVGPLRFFQLAQDRICERLAGLGRVRGTASTQ